MLIFVLCVLLLWFGLTIVQIENQRNALWLGMCPALTGENESDVAACLDNTETRTNGIWHLYYALTDSFREY